MFYSERKKVLCSIFTVFVHGYLSAAMFKCSILNDAGILNPPEYATYMDCIYLQVPDKR